MPENTKIATKEVSWNEFLELTDQSASRDTITGHLNDGDEDPVSVREKERKAAAMNRLRVIHAYILGFYKEVVPVGNDAEALKKLNSVEQYVIRVAGKWEPFERLMACEASLHSSGVWMPVIARALMKVERKMERRKNAPAGFL